MSRFIDQRARRAICSIGLALSLCGVLAGPAMAAPVLEAKLSNDANEVQWVSVRGTTGQFRLSFGQGGPGVSETEDISVPASAAAIQSALNGLSNISAGGGSVTVAADPNPFAVNAQLYFVTFNGGPFANNPVEEMRGINGTTPLSGLLQSGISVTEGTPSGISRADERITYTLDARNGSGSDPTSGLVTAEIAFPSGSETAILKTEAEGWACTNSPPAGGDPAKLTCTRSAPVGPDESFPRIRVAMAPSADTPEHAVAVATISGGGAAGPAQVSDGFDFLVRSFGLRSFHLPVLDAKGDDYTQAGGHPFSASADLTFTKKRSRIPIPGSEDGERNDAKYAPIDGLKNANVDSPRGFVGNALASPVLCPSAAVLALCPEDSIVGVIQVEVGILELNKPVYSIEPEFGAPAEFAYEDPVRDEYTVIPRLRADEGYALEFQNSPVAPTAGVLHAKFNFCGFGARSIQGGSQAECLDKNDPQANDQPLISNPTRCAGAPPAGGVVIDSWQNPGEFKTYEDVAPAETGCASVPFEPEATLAPTNHQADSPTGLNVEFTMPTNGLLEKEGIAQANLDNAVVTFPKGMSVNPAAADGLSGCSLAQIKMRSNDPEECPLSSRIGEVEVDTPLLRETLTGSVYLAKQHDNPFNSAFGIYMAFSSARDGVRVKVAGKLVPDPVTGQLVSTFAENPEWPFSRLAIKFNTGPRAPLLNPPTCGTYAIHSELSPWSAVNPANPTPQEIVSHDSTYEVTSGPDGSPCPNGSLDATLSSGLQRAEAGTKSPFNLTLTREDGSQRLTGLEVTTPKGLTAYLKGIPYCPDAVLAGIPTAEETGGAELASPACPAESQVGTVTAGAGSGPFPIQTPGKVYLAGPYRGAPVSLVVVTPAVAGPFDLGNVVIRNGLYIDPVTSQVTTKSDPIPTVLHGLLLDLRQIHLALDRPGFTAAPTNCEPMAVDARISGQDGGSAALSNRFQVGNCEALGFKPALSLRLFGGTRRGSHPRLAATLTATPGDANIAGVSVALPHSEFLDQAHIRTICTRVEFAAGACPQGSIYGEAEATTPLLDNPLRGPVYLRSSDNVLPDLVAALRGPDAQPIQVVLAGRIDSLHGGLRTSFEAVPDQPVSTFTLRMQGGRKGLLVNSRNICKATARATAKFTAQNGRTATLRPVLQNSCKKKPKRHRHDKHR